MTMTDPVQLTDQQRADLDVARRLAEAGIPVFVAPPNRALEVLAGLGLITPPPLEGGTL